MLVPWEVVALRVRTNPRCFRTKLRTPTGATRAARHQPIGRSNLTWPFARGLVGRWVDDGCGGFP